MKLVSLNVEQDKHLTSVVDFIEREKADIVAMMEVCEDNLDTLLTGYTYRHFAPNFLYENRRRVGVVIASHTPLTETGIFYADGVESDDIPPHGMGTHRPVVVMAQALGYPLAATHFTWTPQMSETVKQHMDLDRLLDFLVEPELLLFGDFNIPRGNRAYKKLARRYSDAIPLDILTTIDPALHRVNKEKHGTLSVVVDYIWSTPRYLVTDVRVVAGVSDHCGVVATVV